MKMLARLVAIVAAATFATSPVSAQKLGTLTPATTVNATDKIPASQNGVTVAVTPAQIGAYPAELMTVRGPVFPTRE